MSDAPAFVPEPNLVLVTPELAAAQGYPEALIGKYVIDGWTQPEPQPTE